jgi:hypothetical protein
MIEITHQDSVICGACGKEDEGLKFSGDIVNEDGGVMLSIAYFICETCLSRAFTKFLANK